MKNDEGLPVGNFSDAERLAIRRLLRDLDRGEWLRRQLKRWGLFLLGVPVTIWATVQALESTWNGLIAILRTFISTRGP